MDSFFGIGIFELFLIAVIALVVMGPERLPGAMRTIAGYMRQIRNISSEFTSQFSEEIKMLEELDPRRMVNDVLDPTKTPAPTNKAPVAKNTPPRATTASNVAKSTAAAAAVAKTTQKSAEESSNSILPPAREATPVDSATQPNTTANDKAATAPSVTNESAPIAAAADDATPPAEAKG